jgi:hypothetical protein
MGVSDQHHAPAALYPGERIPGTHWTGGWVGPRAGLNTEDRGKILCPCRGSNLVRPVVQPVVRHYTAWANSAPNFQIFWLLKFTDVRTTWCCIKQFVAENSSIKMNYWQIFTVIWNSLPSTSRWKLANGNPRMRRRAEWLFRSIITDTSNNEKSTRTSRLSCI